MAKKTKGGKGHVRQNTQKPPNNGNSVVESVTPHHIPKIGTYQLPKNKGGGQDVSSNMYSSKIFTWDCRSDEGVQPLGSFGSLY